MKHGLKTEIAEAIGKTVSFICQYFNDPNKKMSWETCKAAAKAFPPTKPQWWADKEFELILEVLSKRQEAA